MAIGQAPNDVKSFLEPHVTFQEAVDGSWGDKVDDWDAFWDEPSYLKYDNDAELVDYELDDTYDALIRRTQHAKHLVTCAGSVVPVQNCPHQILLSYPGQTRDAELTRQAKAAISKDLRSITWHEKHPDAVFWMGDPGKEKDYDPEVPDPEPLPERDWTDLELRAWVEKRKWQAGKDAEWLKRQQGIGRYGAIACH